ncbi:MAG: DUF169 domain-containing protein, partial [Nitrospira sp.]|nr:DUF169 domain-containing protein [Nitrospira sp.]
VPAGIEVFDQAVPSACTFWWKAASQVFYAPAEKHFNCPIGAMTLGFDMPEAVQQELMGFVQKMSGAGYIAPGEPEKIPTLKKKHIGVVYGPLKAFPLEPDLILMWLTPRQAMLYSEAMGTCRWTETAPTAVFGRPACGALPIVLEHSQPALSLGCAGMRTFTEISEDRLLAALPGKKVQDFLNTLTTTLQANETMQAFYNGHKAKFVV